MALREGYTMYEVVIRALAAESVPAAPGTTVAFACSFDDCLQTTLQEEIESDGFVEWDSTCTLKCAVPNKSKRPSFCSFKLVAVPQDDQNNHTVVCETALDIGELCAAGNKPSHYTIDLHPAGRLHLSICAQCDSPNTAEQPIVSTTTSSIYHSDRGITTPDADTVSEGSADQWHTAVQKQDRSLADGMEQLEISEDVEQSDTVGQGSLHSWLQPSGDDSVDVPSVDSDGIIESESKPTPARADSPFTIKQGTASYATPASSISSASDSDAPLTGGDPAHIIHTLRKKCHKLIQAREEARAETFAQASVVVQRGIEIDNLKRAKEMLLRRLEVAESELLASCQRGNDTNSEGSKSPISADEPKDMELLQTLVACKVELAQKDYAIMELQGQLRHAEAHAATIAAQLAMSMEANKALTQSHHSWWPVSPNRSPVKLSTPNQQHSQGQSAAGNSDNVAAESEVSSRQDSAVEISEVQQDIESIPAKPWLSNGNPVAIHVVADGTVATTFVW